MKLSDIKTDGTVYWFERRNTWGDYLAESYDRFRCTRADNERYDRRGASWNPTYRPHEKGRYVRVLRNDGVEEYVLASQVRDVYDAVKARYDLAEADRKAKAQHLIKVQRSAEADAEALRERVERAGLADVLHVGTGRTRWNDETRVVVSIGYGADQKTALERLLEILEARQG